MDDSDTISEHKFNSDNMSEHKFNSESSQKNVIEESKNQLNKVQHNQNLDNIRNDSVLKVGQNLMAENENIKINENESYHQNHLNNSNDLNNLNNLNETPNDLEMEIENNSCVSNSQNCQNNNNENGQNEKYGYSHGKQNVSAEVTESHSFESENNSLNVQNNFGNNTFLDCVSNNTNEMNEINNSNELNEMNNMNEMNKTNVYTNVTVDPETNITQFLLFEDTEYFESICSTNKKRINGSKNINDFAKMCSLFMMYFFNTFGIEFKIKGEGKTFPMITEITFGNESISNVMIQEFGKRHFSEMVRGNQLAPESILMKERECDKETHSAICKFFMSIQMSVYHNVKEYLLFIQFITNKFYNLYCNDDRERVMRMWEEGDQRESLYVKNSI